MRHLGSLASVVIVLLGVLAPRAWAESEPGHGDLVRVRHGQRVVEGYVVARDPRSVVVSLHGAPVALAPEQVMQTATDAWKWRLGLAPVAGAASGVLTILAVGAIGMGNVDNESLGIGAGIIGGVGLLTGALIAGFGPRFHDGGDGLPAPALADRVRLSSLSLHGGVIKSRGNATEPAVELRLLHDGLVPNLGIGASVLTSTGADTLLDAGVDARYSVPGALRPFAAASLKYVSWDSATEMGNRDKALTVQLGIGARIRPPSSRVFGEVEVRYAQRLVTFVGEERDGFFGGSAGVGVVF